jgi:uncharacterized membrane protein YphA (DoxX/SURF4 family)
MLYIFSVVISLVTQYASSFVMIDIANLQSETDPMVMLEKIREYLLPMALISLMNLLFTAILQHYILYNPVDNENNIFRSVIKSLRYFIPFLVLIILLSFTGAIAIILGLLALVVGAVFAVIYIMTLYLFILPVMMVEGPDIGNTISSVFKLAHRNFWSNFGWVSAFIILLIVISFILSGLVMVPFAGSFFKTIVNPEEASAVSGFAKNPLFIILSALANALTIPLMPIFSTILYFNGKARENKIGQDYLPEKQEERVKVEDLYAKPYSDDHPDNPEKK